MLSRLIVQSYETLIEVALWVFLIVAFIGGWIGTNFFGGLLSLGLAFVFAVVVFGSFLVVLDIRRSVRALELRQERR